MLLFDEQSIENIVYELENGERSWFPVVSAEFKPYVGARFRTLDEVVIMYEEYAEKAGFSTRLSTTKTRNGIVRLKYILCSRANKPKGLEVESIGCSSSCSSRCTNLTELIAKHA